MAHYGKNQSLLMRVLPQNILDELEKEGII